MKYEDIAIIGISGVFPEAGNIQEFWKNLVAGKDSIRDLPEKRVREFQEVFNNFSEDTVKNGYIDEVTKFDPGYFNISEEEARFMDPQQRMALELVEKAILDAGYSSVQIAEHLVGTFMAYSKNNYGERLSVFPLGVVNSLEAAMAGRVAYTFNFKGPALTIDTACSSSLVALHYACTSLINEECEYAIVGGCNAFILPQTWKNMADYPVFAKSEKLCAFDSRANGTLGGEGGASLVLKPLMKAKEDRDSIYAIIKGSAVNSDAGRSTGLTAPSQRAQSEVIQKALRYANLSEADISYIEAHGTGTKLGDPIEVQGLDCVFATAVKKTGNKIPIGSVKTNIGHLVGMAGIAGLIKVVLSIINKKLPPSINYQVPNPLIDFDNSAVYVNDKLSNWNAESPLRAGVSSFGIIGTNAHVIIEEYIDEEKINEEEELVNIFTFSARSEGSLRNYLRKMTDFLRANDKVGLNSLAYTLAVGRRHFKHRISFGAHSVDGLIEQLSSNSIEKIDGNDERSKIGLLLPPLETLNIFFDFESVDVGLFDYNELDGDKRENSVINIFIRSFAFIKYLQSIGIPINAVMGIGSGKILADFLQEKYDFTAAVELLNKYEEKLVDIEKVVTNLAIMQEKGYAYFIQLNSQEYINKIISDNMYYDSYLSVQNGDKRSFENLIVNLYNKGYDFLWQNIFNKKKLKRMHIPTYDYDHKSYFLKNRGGLSDFNCSEETTESSSDALKKQQTSKKDVRETLSGILFELVSNDMDLNLSFEDNGGDSIAIMQITAKIKELFAVSLPIDVFYESKSIHSFLESASTCIINASVKETENDTPGVSKKPENQDYITKRVLEEKVEQLNVKDEILSILGSILQEDINFEADFESNGGDSIAIMQLNNEFKKLFGYSIPIDKFYEVNSIHEFIDFLIHDLEKSASTYEQKTNTVVHCTVDGNFTLSDEKLVPKRILLTGATGFYGAHLLHEIICNVDSVIYCLVRGDSDELAIEKCKKIWEYYFGAELIKEIGVRIIIVRGDITLRSFGVPTSVYEELSNIIDAVIHCAASVKQFGKYEDFEKINVKGTQHIIDLCLYNKAKVLHHCSTYVVSGRHKEKVLFKEEDLVKGQVFNGNNYARTKYEAEVLINKYRAKGLKASVYRIGNLTGRSYDGKFQLNIEQNLLYSSLKALSQIASYTDEIADFELEINPVDHCCKKFLKILLLKNASGYNYHLMDSKKITYRKWIDAMEANGIGFEKLNSDDFLEHMCTIKTDTADVEKFRYFYENLDNDSQNTIAPDYSFDFTNRVLGIQALDYDEPSYLMKAIKHCVKVNFIKN